MIRVYDSAIPAELCERTVAAIKDEEERLDLVGRLATTVFPESSPLVALSHELHVGHVLPLLWEVVCDESGLSPTRSSCLPGLSRLLHESGRPGEALALTEPVPWPVRDGLCLLACLNDGSEDCLRSFSRQGRRVRHRQGRVIVAPTSWTHDYTFQPGSSGAFTLAVFATVSQSARLHDLDPTLTPDERRSAEVLEGARGPAARGPWLPSPPLGDFSNRT